MTEPENENGPRLIAEKLSAVFMVPPEFLADCQLNLTDYLANPHLYARPAPVPLTRRQKAVRRIREYRVRLAAFLYERVSGEDLPRDD